MISKMKYDVHHIYRGCFTKLSWCWLILGNINPAFIIMLILNLYPLRNYFNMSQKISEFENSYTHPLAYVETS